MGDLLGSPRVAPLFMGLAGYHSGLPLVVPMVSALPIAIGAGRSSIRSPDRKIRAVEIVRQEFFPVFFSVEDPIVGGRSAGNGRLFRRSRRNLWVETPGGEDGSRRGSMRICFMRR